MIKLYQNIRKLRKEYGWSQDELAKRMGYSDRSTIAKIESGFVDLSESKIMAFAQIFNVAPSDLMGWDDEEPTPAIDRQTREFVDLYTSADPLTQKTVVNFLKSAKQDS